MMQRPTLVPICEKVLKTAAPRAWDFPEKTSAMTSEPTMKVTSILKGPTTCAQKALYQYGHEGLVIAMSIGDSEQSTMATMTAARAETRLMKTPAKMQQSAPVAACGRRRREAWKAVRRWTFWKLDAVS